MRDREALVIRHENNFSDTPDTDPVTIANTKPLASLGAETDFTARAFYSLASLRSLTFDEVAVRKT